MAGDDAGTSTPLGGVVAGLNVLTNDTLNGDPIVPAAVTIAPVTNGPLTVNADGTVTVAPGTPAGPYTVTYQVCEKLNPGNCGTALVTVNVNAGNIAADADAVSGVNGLTGAADVLDVLPGDTLNGAPALLGGAGNVTMSVVTPATPLTPGAPVPALNAATGLISVPANTPAGSYPITYRICETLNPANCATAIATVGVIAAPIVAGDDAPPVVDSAAGNPSLVNVFANDILNGVPTVPASITATIITPASDAGVSLDPATGIVSVLPGTPAGTYAITYQICETANPANCDQAVVNVTVAAGLGTLSGVVYEDSNSNDSFDPSEPVEGGYTVQLLQNGIVVATTISNPDGTYQFTGIQPGPGYTVAAFSPDGTRIIGEGVITIAAGQNVTDVNLPIDPSGIVYDAITRQPVAGAVLQLTTASGAPLPAVCLVTPAQQNQITGPSGAYRFDIAAGAAPQCPAGETEYRISVTSPVGYLPGTAASIPPQSGALEVTGCAPDVVLGGSCQLQAQPGAPAAGAPTPYYLRFLIAAGDPDVVHNHIPLDPVPVVLPAELSIAKLAASRIAIRGGQMSYTIRVSNPTAAAVGPVRITDRAPSGFTFVDGSGSVNGAAAVPVIDGRDVSFANITVPANARIDIVLKLTVPVNAGPGDFVNEARGFDPVTGAQIGNVGRVTVSIEAEPVFDCSDLIGKVFDDRNRNGIQDAQTSPYEPERGLPGVRLVTVKGELITTDKNGRYNVPCAMIPDAAIGSNFILKLDTRTLPTGYRVTTDNPRTIRLTKGKVSKLNFGAAITRVVRLDLKHEAFVKGGTELAPQWAAGISALVDELKKGESVLRLRYLGAGKDVALAKKRAAAVGKLVQQAWKQRGADYRLEIETTVLK